SSSLRKKTGNSNSQDRSANPCKGSPRTFMAWIVKQRCPDRTAVVQDRRAHHRPWRWHIAELPQGLRSKQRTGHAVKCKGEVSQTLVERRRMKRKALAVAARQENQGQKTTGSWVFPPELVRPLLSGPLGECQGAQARPCRAIGGRPVLEPMAGHVICYKN